jgi:hypothetical protein
VQSGDTTASGLCFDYHAGPALRTEMRSVLRTRLREACVCKCNCE